MNERVNKWEENSLCRPDLHVELEMQATEGRHEMALYVVTSIVSCPICSLAEALI